MNWVVLVLALLTGILSLVTAGTVGTVLLRVVAASAALYFAVALTRRMVFRERASLKARIRVAEGAALQVAHERDRYRDVINRLIDRQTVNYEEKLHIHVFIGETDDGDRIIEEHVTSPTPRLYYRSLRPIYPRGSQLTLEDMNFKVEIDHGDGILADVFQLSESPMRILVMFDPTVERVIKWTLSYRTPGLWAPLRCDGRDDMTWDAGSPSGRRDESTFTGLEFSFEFPSGVTEARVQARGRHGSIATRSLPSGQLRRSWKISDPPGNKYGWDLTMGPRQP
jgi:hypothetical protein